MKKKSSGPRHRDPLVSRIARQILNNHLFAQDDTVIVAVSGGPDSSALLHLLFRIGLQAGLVGVYIDHGLRPDETGNEIKIAAAFCATLKIPFETIAVDVSSHRLQTGASIEEAARTVRYAALESARIRHNASVIAVGHTADDQAEEILLRLIRGSGRAGLSGMSGLHNLIVRPLLNERKDVLIDYLYRNKIPYCLDSSNQSRRFLRNRVRLDLLPYLEQNFNPGIRETLLRTAEIFRLEEELLEQMTQESCTRLIRSSKESVSLEEPHPNELILAIPPFLKIPVAIQRRVLETLFWRMSSPPGFKQIEQVRNLLVSGNTGNEIHLGHGLRVWRTGDEALFSHPGGLQGLRGSGLRPKTISLMIDGPGDYIVAGHRLHIHLTEQQPSRPGPGEIFLDADRLSFPLQLRHFLPGERFWPLGAPGRKKLSRFLNDAKIPRQKRQDFPVLVAAGKIVAVVGLRIDHDVRLREDSRRILVVGWQPVTSSCA